LFISISSVFTFIFFQGFVHQPDHEYSNRLPRQQHLVDLFASDFVFILFISTEFPAYSHLFSFRYFSTNQITNIPTGFLANNTALTTL